MCGRCLSPYRARTGLGWASHCSHLLCDVRPRVDGTRGFVLFSRTSCRTQQLNPIEFGNAFPSPSCLFVVCSCHHSGAELSVRIQHVLERSRYSFLDPCSQPGRPVLVLTRGTQVGLSRKRHRFAV